MIERHSDPFDDCEHEVRRPAASSTRCPPAPRWSG